MVHSDTSVLLASVEGQDEHFPVWKKKGHGYDKNRRKTLNIAVPGANREAILSKWHILCTLKNRRPVCFLQFQILG